MQKYLIVIAGPTASGKTALGIRLAQEYDTVVLSADSRQFYKEMSIGTAKPDSEELAAATHHFIDSLSIHEDYSVGDYERDALALLDDLFQEKNVVLLVGGSGLFISAVTNGLDKFPPVPTEIRDKYTQLEAEQGLQALQHLLAQKDPEYYAKVDIHNPHRLIRALSVIEASGQTFSSFHTQSRPERPFKTIEIVLNWDRELLYDRINRRVDMMLDAGLLAEVEALYPLKHLNALQTVGYQEIFDAMDDKISMDEAIELVKRNSRRYAKRQLTWFRKWTNAGFYHPEQYDDIQDFIQQQMTKLA